MDDHHSTKITAPGTSMTPAVEDAPLTDFLRASRAEFEGLFAKSQEIQQMGWQVLHSLLEELHTRLRQELETASGSYVKETRRRAEGETSAALELFDIELNARLAARVDDALARSQAAHQKMEQSLKARAEEYQHRLSELSAGALEALKQKAEAAAAGFRTELGATLDELRAQGLSEVSIRLEETTGELADAFAKRADSAVEAFNERVAASRKALVDETDKQISALTQSALAGLTKDLESAHRRLSAFVLDHLHQRLDQVAGALTQIDVQAAIADVKQPGQRAATAGAQGPSGTTGQ